MAYMAQHEVRAELTRIFGFGNWDSEVVDMTMIYETELKKGDPQYPERGNGQPYYVTCYKAGVRLNIRDYEGNPICSFLEYHAEENAPLPNRGEAHAMAVTSVQSYALRRAAIGLGDRLGLGLYNKGSQAALVVGSLQLTDKDSPLYEAEADEPPLTTEAPAERDWVGEAFQKKTADEVLAVWRDAKAAFGTRPDAEQAEVLKVIAGIGEQLRASENPEGAAQSALAKGFNSKTV
jgi:hypothetical protein